MEMGELVGVGALAAADGVEVEPRDCAEAGAFDVGGVVSAMPVKSKRAAMLHPAAAASLFVEFRRGIRLRSPQASTASRAMTSPPRARPTALASPEAIPPRTRIGMSP